MSWWQLKAIREIQRAEQSRENERIPHVCPIDGSILDVHPDGVRRNCPMGDYQYPRDMPLK